MMFQIAGTLSLAIDNKTEANFLNIEDHFSYLNQENEYNPKLNYAEEYKKLNIFKQLKESAVARTPRLVTFPFHYEKRFIDSTEETLVDGFFQSEKYFVHNEKSIRSQFSMDSFIKDYLKSKYNHLLSLTNITSIHVRRGDYVNTSNHHPPLTMDYFRQAINECLQYTKKYVVFSDDIEWCKTKFQGNKFVFVENEKDYIELYFMSLCSNHIISNSSFSWWGAWLNNKADKKVFAPKKWFGPTIKESTVDIIPIDWIIK